MVDQMGFRREEESIGKNSVEMFRSYTKRLATVLGQEAIVIIN